MADTRSFSDHARHELLGHSAHFKPGKCIPFGHFRYIKPTASHPEIRARFTPGAGLVFGPRAGDSQVNDDVSSRAHQAVRGLRRVPGDTRMTVEMAGLFVWLQSLRQGVLDKRGHFGARKIRSWQAIGDRTAGS